MKKILLFAILACFLSNCDKKDEQPKILKFSPPSWIHGNWLLKNNPAPNKAGYKFTQDDFCMILGEVTACHKDMVKRGQVEILSQKSYRDIYEIALKNSSRRFTAKFRKKSATEIEQVGNGVTHTFVKQKKILKFSPPSWIHGTWLRDGLLGKTGYRFSKDDFCLVDDSLSACFKTMVNAGRIKVTHQKSSKDTYELTLKNEALTYRYKFEKRSSIQIETVQSGIGSHQYRSTFMRQ